MNNIEAVRCVRKLIDRLTLADYPEFDMDGCYFVPFDNSCEDEVVAAVASSFGINPSQLWNDYQGYCLNEEYKWFEANTQLIGSIQ